MPTKLFPKQKLLGIIYGEEDGFVSNELKAHGRWSLCYKLIFKDGDDYYSVYYSGGATELQDENPFDAYDNEVPCDKVRRVEVTTISYERI
tara:strand:- start:2260 stop:2532 length:273 start_codon:yes stop_codon:yes gene_type:complete